MKFLQVQLGRFSFCPPRWQKNAIKLRLFASRAFFTRTLIIPNVFNKTQMHILFARCTSVGAAGLKFLFSTISIANKNEDTGKLTVGSPFAVELQTGPAMYCYICVLWIFRSIDRPPYDGALSFGLFISAGRISAGR